MAVAATLPNGDRRPLHGESGKYIAQARASRFAEHVAQATIRRALRVFDRSIIVENVEWDV
jgi:hypothetical protein